MSRRPADDRVAHDAAGDERSSAIDVRSSAIDVRRRACLRLARTGTVIGWGLFGLGFVAALERVLLLVSLDQASSGAWVRAWAGIVFSILAYGLAGLATAALAGMTAAAISEYIDRVSRFSDDLVCLATRMADQVEPHRRRTGADSPGAASSGTARCRPR